MKLNALAHASVDQLTLIRLRLEPCEVSAQHKYTMQPAPTERFVYIIQGKVCFTLPKGKLWAGTRDMVYLPRDITCHSTWLEDSRFVVVDLLLHDGDGQPIHFEDAPSVLFHDTHHIYSNLLTELVKKSETTEPFDWLERMSLSFKLLYEMARDTNRKELDKQNRRIKEALTYLDNNYIDDISIEDLAQLCSLSVSSFRRIFVACKGMSPVEYRNRLRVQKAAELLKTGKHTVSEAAEAVGIQDIKYFGKLFKRYTGMNPGFLKRNGL